MARMKAFWASLSCWLVCVPTVIGQTAPPSFPSFPSSYSTVISINNEQYGYTLAYDEIYDSTLTPRKLRTVSRDLPSGTVEIISFDSGTGTVTQIPTNSTLPCTRYQLTQDHYNDILIAPTSMILSSISLSLGLNPALSAASFTYGGVSNIARGINADLWSASQTLSNGPNSTRYDFLYLTARGQDVAGLTAGDPVRFQLNTTYSYNIDNVNLTSSVSYNTIYDWVRFNRSKPSSSLFDAPTCQSVSPSRIPLPTSSTLSPPYSTNASISPLPPFPGLPSQFSMVLEVKLSDTPATTSSTRLYTLSWQFDASTSVNSQRIGYLDAVNGYTDVIFSFDSNFVYTSTSSGCVFQLASLDNTSPLQELRAGSIQLLFQNPNNIKGATYIGINTARGIPCDVWRIPVRTIQNGQTYFTFYTDVYYFRAGWQFPGRSLSSSSANSSLPLRIINAGNRTTPFAFDLPFYDIWDIYELLTVAPASVVFNPSSLNCPSPLSPNSTRAIMPIPSTHYSATISANFLEKGYTLSFDEYYDSTQGRLRSDGKLMSSNQINIVDFIGGTSTVYTLPSTTSSSSTLDITPCTVASYKLDRTSITRVPTVTLFSQFNSTNVIYQGNTTRARNILCDYWMGSYFGVTNNIQLTFQAYYYFAVPQVASSSERVPVRVELFGSKKDLNTNISQPLTHTYDWINWITSPQDTSLFEIPNDGTGCVWGTNPIVSLPSQSQVIPQPNMSLPYPAPTLPSQFTTVLETKLADRSSSIYAVKWMLDYPSRERIDYNTNDGSPLSSLIYVYYPPTSTYYPGDYYFYTKGACDGGYLDESIAPINPLLNVRAGSIPKLFENDTLSNDTYIGRVNQVVRGLIVDAYISSVKNVTRAGYLYTYVRTTYFFAQGWQLPGRNVSGYSRLPVRVFNSGNMTDLKSGVSTAYSDTWDLFEMIPGPPPSIEFDSNILGCPNLHPSQTNYTTADVVMGAVLGVLLGGMVIGGLGYTVMQKIAKKKQEELLRKDEDNADPEAIELPREPEPEHEQEPEDAYTYTQQEDLEHHDGEEEEEEVVRIEEAEMTRRELRD